MLFFVRKMYKKALPDRKGLGREKLRTKSSPFVPLD